MKTSLIVKVTALIFIIISGCTAPKSSIEPEEKHLITGTWQVKDEPGNIWVFTDTECRWVINGNVYKRFNYNITYNTSPSGLEHSYVNLTEVEEPASRFNYGINSLGLNYMTLETIEPKPGYIHFVKQ